MDKATALMALISGISGLALAWLAFRQQAKSLRQQAKSFRQQAKSSVIDDIDQIRQALKEENERLGKQMEHLRKQLENETLKRVALEERLDIEREVFSKRIEKLEAELKQLRHLRSNV